MSQNELNTELQQNVTSSIVKKYKKDLEEYIKQNIVPFDLSVIRGESGRKGENGSTGKRKKMKNRS